MSKVHRLSFVLGHSLFIVGCIVFSMLAVTTPTRGGTIGLSIPLSGDAAELGQSFRTGAKIAMETYGTNHQLFIADDGCDADLGALAAGDLKSQNVDIVVGLICNAPAKTMADAFAEAKTPVIVAGARSVRLIKDREREAWNLWRMSPGDDYAVEVAANAIGRLWQTTPYAIVDDGTIYGRSFTDALRVKMDEIGFKTPVFRYVSCSSIHPSRVTPAVATFRRYSGLHCICNDRRSFYYRPEHG